MHKVKFILLIILFSSCESDLFNNSETVIVEKEISDFKTIIINDIFDVNLIQDTINRVFIEGGSDIISKINVSVKNDSLFVSNSNTFRWIGNYDRVVVNISVKNLHNLRLNAPCNVKSINNIETYYLNVKAIAEMSDIDISMNTDNFYFVNSATSGGQYIFSGNTINLAFWIRGSGKISTEDLNCKSADIISSTIADSYITVENKLKVKIEKNSKVYYKGNPQTLIIEDANTQNNLIKLD